MLPIDKIPIKKIRRTCGFIVNTHDSSLPGEHWFAIYLPKYGKIEYFDSYGIKPINHQVYELIKTNQKSFIYNTKPIQGADSTNCGKYCIFFLYMRARGYNMKKILKFFVNNKQQNDLFINSLFKKIIKNINTRNI